MDFFKIKWSNTYSINVVVYFKFKSIYDQEYIDIVNFFTNSLSKVFIQYIYY